MNSQPTRNGVGVVRERHQTHAREERGIERQHSLGLILVASVTQRKEARRRGAKIDNRKEEGRERIEPEMGADPWQADRQHKRLRRPAQQQEGERRREPNQG